MSSILNVDLGSRSYEIVLEEGVLSELPREIASFAFDKKCAVITDTTVAGHYLQPVIQALKSEGYDPIECVVPAGENSKSMTVVADLLSRLARHRMERRSFIIALGGGVIGDLAGFVAASYLRGIPFVQVPTTLLSQVDSSVGGKTGVNLPEGKNLVGAFCQPRRVLIDLEVLHTLSDREYAAGLAEVVKYGIISDAAFFGKLEKDREAIWKRDPVILERVVHRCCELKAQVVSEDEFETRGLREILNFGHTIGHAIENAAGYGEWLHGEAVAIGMYYECLLSETYRGLPAEATARVEALLKFFKLPVRMPALKPDDVMAAMFRDKKVRFQKLRFVLADSIGQVTSGIEVPETSVRKVMGFENR